MLIKEIGYELYRYIMLIDAALNQFEIVVHKKNDKLCLTHGVNELNNTYNLKFGEDYIGMCSPKNFCDYCLWT